MRPLDLLIYRPGASPRECGRLHGQRFADEIAELVSIRAELSRTVGNFPSDAEVQRIARAHLPVLERYDARLYAEVLGIAEGAGCSPEDVVILNHYTDLRDIDPTSVPSGDHGCTVLYGPAHDTGGPWLGQTWDTAASATHFGLLLGVPRSEATPAMWLLSIVGCVGMAGFNEHGVGVVINNLKSTDAQVGAIWPAIIRSVLAAETFSTAREALDDAPIGSGHHYLLSGPDGMVGLETSGRLRAVVAEDAKQAFHHTNHCLSPLVDPVTKVSPTSTTYPRFAAMAESLAGAPTVRDLDDLWARLALVSYENDLTRHDIFATCSAMAIDLGARRAIATRGMARASDDSGAPLAPLTTLRFDDGMPVVESLTTER